MEIDVSQVKKSTPVISTGVKCYELPGGWLIQKTLLDRAWSAVQKRGKIHAKIDPQEQRLVILFGDYGRLSLCIHKSSGQCPHSFPAVFHKTEQSYRHDEKCVVVAPGRGAFAIVGLCRREGLLQRPMPQVLAAALSAEGSSDLLPTAFKIPPKKTTPAKDYQEGIPYDDDCFLVGDREVPWSQLSRVVGSHKRLTYLSISPIIAIYSDGKLIGGVAYTVRDFRIVAPLIPGAKATSMVSMEIHKNGEELLAFWDRADALIKVRRSSPDPLVFEALNSVELVQKFAQETLP